MSAYAMRDMCVMFCSTIPPISYINLLTSLFTLGLSVLSLAGTAMVQLEKYAFTRAHACVCVFSSILH
jgi:hypothetical protein